MAQKIIFCFHLIKSKDCFQKTKYKQKKKNSNKPRIKTNKIIIKTGKHFLTLMASCSKFPLILFHLAEKLNFRGLNSEFCPFLIKIIHDRIYMMAPEGPSQRKGVESLLFDTKPAGSSDATYFLRLPKKKLEILLCVLEGADAETEKWKQRKTITFVSTFYFNLKD